jgi:SAM-dependent methyltransferase
MFDGMLHFAPIGDHPQKVLDVGTGTGIWAIDFADQYPSAEIIGTDLSPIQPSWVPPNLRFEIDDCTDSWTYEPNSFDYIHVRGLYGCVKDWPQFYREVMDHLKPGGWYEQVEYSVHWRADDGSIPEGHVFQQWSELFVEAGERIGKTFRILDLQKQFLIDGGFDNVVEKKYKMPVGPWSSDPKLKDVGKWHLFECYQGIEGWSMALLTRVMGWSEPEVQVFLAQVREAFKDKSVHAYTSV